MAWPPPVLPTNRTNATPQQDTHPADHNAIAQAINDTVATVQALQGLGYKGHAYTAVTHPGIAQAQVNLNNMRVDWVVETSHIYLVISTCTYNVDAGGIVVQRNIAGNGTFGVAQLTIQPGSWGTVNNIALYTGPAGPNFIQVTAQVSAGFTTANDRSLMIYDLT
jgi:hypothetical protein